MGQRGERSESFPHKKIPPHASISGRQARENNAESIGYIKVNPWTPGVKRDQVGSIPHLDFMSNLTGRFRMLGMRWKALDCAMNLS